jgi:hypothetical protein
MTRSDYTALIDGIGTGEKNTAAEIRNLLGALRDGIHLTGDMKPIKCDEAYIAINFDATGLGKLEREGWAICNGLNTTWDVRDRTLIGYGGDYKTPGHSFGSKNAIVVSHNHTINQIKGYGPTQGADGFYDRSQSESAYGIETESTGESGTNQNYQPSIVVVWIQKL